MKLLFATFICVLALSLFPQFAGNVSAADNLPSTNVSTPLAKPSPKTEIDSDTRLVLRSVSERYKKFKKWEAKFSQETFSIGLGKGTYNEGRFVFEAPNKFRYSIIRPEASDFISNGKEAWYISYRDGRNKPAYVRHFKNLSQIELDRYLIVLRGIDAQSPAKEKKLLQDFAVEGKSSPLEVVLHLSPKNSAEISKITLAFKNNEPVLNKAIITDSMGNTTTLIVTAHQNLDKIDPKEFVPDYPKSSQVEEM